MAFYLVSVNFGGGRIGTSPFLLATPVSTSEEDRQNPPPHNDREYLGGGRTGLPPRTVGMYLMHLIGNDDELNILHSLTYRTVTVEGDRAVFLRLCRS